MCWIHGTRWVVVAVTVVSEVSREGEPLGRYKRPLFLKVGSKHHCHCHLLEHGRNPESQALGQTHEVRI